MATDIPFTAEGALKFPPDDDLPQVAIPASVASVFKTISDNRFNLTGAGTQVVSLGAIPAAGAKALLIEVAADSSPSAAPVMITINDADTAIELAPGGFILYANPKPVAGITDVSLAYTTAATVRVRVLG